MSARGGFSGGDEKMPPGDVASWEEAMHLLPNHQAPAAARTFLRHVLAAHDLDDRDHDAQVVVSELVSNAVAHAGDHGPIQLTVTGRPADVLRIAVTDHGPDYPTVRFVSQYAVHGYGMRIVDQLADRWGVERLPGRGGKRVWAELRQRRDDPRLT